MAGHGAHRE